MKTSVIVLWICVVLVILALIAPRVWSRETLNWPNQSGHYTEHLCALCDKRIYKYHEPSSWRDGSMILHNDGYVIIPSGPTAFTLSADMKLIVCEECEKEWRERYVSTMKVHKEEFLESARRMNFDRIEQNRKDNATYKEKQDEIERLRERIRELETDKNWGKFNDKFKWSAGTSNIPSDEERRRVK